MLTLTPHEARVLGVLIEKAQTTPQQYPMTLNAMVAGANQKNNREPVTNLSEAQVFEALEGLRAKRLANEVMLTGSRVQKYRHIARETLEIGTGELVILAEFLLRGPQTVGELRSRASRMHPLESTDVVKNILDGLMTRAEPMVKELPPAPGDRAARFMQLLCPKLHPENAAAPPLAASRTPLAEDHTGYEPETDFLPRIQHLEAEVAALKHTVNRLAESLGASDLIKSSD